MGINVSIINIEEPAYGAKVHLYLPLPVLRVPSSCSLKGFNMSCDLPAPMFRNEEVSWIIEFDYKHNDTDEADLFIKAVLHEPLEFLANKTNIEKNVTLRIIPQAYITVTGLVDYFLFILLRKYF